MNLWTTFIIITDSEDENWNDIIIAYLYMLLAGLLRPTIITNVVCRAKIRIYTGNNRRMVTP